MTLCVVALADRAKWPLGQHGYLGPDEADGNGSREMLHLISVI